MTQIHVTPFGAVAVCSGWSVALLEHIEVVRALWDRLLGPGNADEDFYAAGGDDLMALRLLRALHVKRPASRISWRDFQEDPCVDTLCCLLDDPPETPLPDWATTAAADRPALLRSYLYALLSRTHEDLIGSTPDLVWALLRDFGFPLYASEVRAAPDLKAFSAYLADELSWHQALGKTPSCSTATLTPLPGSHAAPPPARLPSVAFLLSAPRSGSTLLRLMLAGHPALHCLPELNLLHHNRLGEWHEARLARFGPDSGVVENLKRDLRVPEIDADEPIELTYRRLQDAVAPKLLIDKTPSYAKSLEVLLSAEERFESPVYVHLVRHPLAVVDSYVRQRFHKLIPAGDLDPHAAAEAVWTARNTNLLALEERVGSERVWRIRFEDLLASPRETLSPLCTFLGVPFANELLSPFAPGRRAGGPGDYGILDRDRLDPSLADAWRSVTTPNALAPATWALAERFGYSRE